MLKSVDDCLLYLLGISFPVTPSLQSQSRIPSQDPVVCISGFVLPSWMLVLVTRWIDSMSSVGVARRGTRE